MRRGFHSRAAIVLMVAMCAACGFGSPANFSLDSASVDPTYACPRGAQNAAYDLHATIAAHNPTSNAVTIKTVAVLMTLTGINGGWMEHVGDRYDAGSVPFNPDHIGSNSNTTISVTVRSACTNPSTSGNGTSSGDYSVAFTVTTSAGTFKLTSKGKHRISA